jgi:hypothetical protein
MNRGPLFDGPRQLALSVRQPWAGLIVAGHKDIENRTWRTSYRGPLLIHAALKSAEMTLPEIEEWQGRHLPLPPCDFGGVIGEVELVDIVTSSSSTWFEGPFGWVLKNPKPMPFRPCKGALSLFEPDFR